MTGKGAKDKKEEAKDKKEIEWGKAKKRGGMFRLVFLSFSFD